MPILLIYNRPRPAALLALLMLVLVLAACDTAAPSPSPAAAPTPSPAVPLTPSPAAGASPTPTLAPDHLSDFHAYPELEARLPEQVGNYEMNKVSLSFSPERQDANTLEVLRRLGHDPEDIQVAVATGGEALQVSAFRIVGADAIAIINAFQQVEEDNPDSQASFGGATIGGKRLITRTTENQLAYLYPSEDIMFVLSGETGLVEQALAQLP